MAIDLTTERILNLSQAANLFPSYRGGKPTHVSRVIRAIRNGSRDPGGVVVFLEALRLNNQWVTSAEAIQRFAERLTPKGQAASTDTPISRRRAVERAERDLEKAGI